MQLHDQAWSNTMQSRASSSCSSVPVWAASTSTCEPSADSSTWCRPPEEMNGQHRNYIYIYKTRLIDFISSCRIYRKCIGKKHGVASFFWAAEGAATILSQCYSNGWVRPGHHRRELVWWRVYRPKIQSRLASYPIQRRTIGQHHWCGWCTITPSTLPKPASTMACTGIGPGLHFSSFFWDTWDCTRNCAKGPEEDQQCW